MDSDTPSVSCPSTTVESCVDGGTCMWTSDGSVDANYGDNCTGQMLSHEISGSTVVMNGMGLVSGTVLNLGINVITYEVEDGSGNTSSCSFQVLVKDCESPTLTCSDMLDVSCGMEDIAGWQSTIESTIGDNCSMSGDMTFSSQLITDFSSCGGTIEQVYEFVVTDEAGNSSSCYGRYESDDNVSPVIGTMASDLTLECNGGNQSSALIGWLNNNGGASASDVCSSPLSWSHDYTGDLVGSCGTNGSVTVVFTVSDGCGNTSTTSGEFTIEDTTSPVLRLPSNIVLECGGMDNEAIIASWLSSAEGEDSCEGLVGVTNDYGSAMQTDGCGLSGVTTVVFTVSDACGNTSTGSRTITIEDRTSPEIVVEASDLVLECGAMNGGAISAWELSQGGAMASDDCSDMALTWSMSSSSVMGCGSSSVTTYVFTVEDNCGNTSTTSASVIIEDSTSPLLVVPMEQTEECGNIQVDLPTWLGSASGSDACGSVSITSTLWNTIEGCGETREEVYLFVATDACGNTSSGLSSYILEDTETPMLVVPTDLTLECGDMNNDQLVLSWLNSAIGSDVYACGSLAISHNYPGSLPSVSCDLSSGVSVTWTISDGCGNSSMGSSTIYMDDSASPVFVNCPSDMSVNVDIDNCSSQVIYSVPVVEDGCSGNGLTPMLTGGIASGQEFPLGLTQITYEVSDGCGNTASCSFGITVLDSDTPSVSCPSTTVESCVDGGTCMWTSDGSVDANYGDNCTGQTLSHEISGSTVVMNGMGLVSGTVLNLGINVITYEVEDGSGNTSSCSFQVLVKDCESPTLTCSDMLDVSCGMEDIAGWQSTIESTIGDNCSMSGDMTFSSQLITDFSSCGGTIEQVYEFVVTDEAGNSSSCYGRYESDDNVSPVIGTMASDLTLECNGGNQSSALIGWLNNNGGASASDVCSSPLSWSHDYTGDLVGSCGTNGSVTVVFTVSDGCGNTSTTSGEFTIEDTTSPVLRLPSNIVLECGGMDNEAIIASWLSSAEGEDSCEGLVGVTNDYGSAVQTDGCGLSGVTTVVFTVSDACGNTSTGSRTITIEDSTSPEIVVEASDLVLECGDPDNQDLIDTWLMDNGNASATDGCSDEPLVWSYIEGGMIFSCGMAGEVSYTFTVEDNCGNISNTIGKLIFIDSTPPSITTLASDMTVECDGTGNNSEFLDWINTSGGAIATDDCSNNLVWSYNLLNEVDSCHTTGSRAFEFQVTDECGNSAVDTALFIIVDTAAPMILQEANDITVICDGNGNSNQILSWLNSNGGATVLDDCSSVTWSNDYGQTTPGACNGTGEIEVVFTATDGCGNSSTTSATMSIIDTNDPVWTIDPTDLTLECTEDSDPMDAIMSWLDASGNGDAFDSCSVIVYSHDFVSLMNGCGGNSTTGEATVVFTATDACGNTSTRSAMVLVEDTTSPEILVPAQDTVVECNGSGNVSDLNNWLLNQGGSMSSDACGDIVWQLRTLLNTIDGCGGTVEYIYSFRSEDLCGNESSTTIASFIIEDTTSPILTMTASDLTVQCDGTGNGVDLAMWLNTNGGAVATENCSGLTWSYDLIEESDACTLTGNGTYVFTATDECGNSVTSEATFTVIDDEDPQITVEAMDITVHCDGSNNTAELLSWLNNNGGASATDNCDQIVWSNDYGTVDAGACEGDGMVTVVFTATDGCGNSSTTSATMSIVDTNDPVWTIDPTDLTLACTEDSDPMDAIMSWLDASGNGDAFDSCSVIVYSHDFVSLMNGCGGNSTTGEATVVFTATDACGNTSTRSAMVLVEDTTSPEILVPAQDTVVECNGSGNVSDLNNWLLNQGGSMSSDACGDIVWQLPTLLNTIDGCGGTVEYIYSFRSEDLCGNESSATIASFIIEDTTSPILTMTASDLTVQCDGTGNGLDLAMWLNTNGGAVATENCSGLTWSYDLIEESDACTLTGNGTYVFTATDACGNSVTSEATFTVIDNEGPQITVEAMDITVHCDGSNNTAELLSWLNNNGGASATDNCDQIVWSNDYGTVDAGACEGDGMVTVVFTATDGCGNSSTTSATMSIVDTNDPVWTIDPTDLTLECTEDSDPMDAIMSWLDASGNGDAFDSCSVIVYSHNFVSLMNGCGGNSTTGEATVVFTATDACGNTSTRSAMVLVEDTTSPEILVPAQDTVVECNGSGNVSDLNNWLLNQGGSMSSDACGDIVWQLPTLLNTIDGCGGTVEYIYSFRSEDLCGNESSATIASFIIEDTTSPVIDPTAVNLTVECDGIGNDNDREIWLVNVANAGAVDLCSNTLRWEYDLISHEDSCGITGIYEYRFTVEDECGNTSQTIGVFKIEDTTPPMITGGADYSGECDQSNANNDAELLSWLNNNGGASVEELCGNVFWTNNFDDNNWIDGCNDSRSIDVTFTASDECGNESSITLNFSTGDNTAPEFINCPRPPVVVDAPQDWCSSFVNFSTPIATDNCGDPIVTQTDTTGLISGDLFPVGLTILEFTATDSCDNETICEVKVIVNDFHLPPSIECPNDTLVVNDLSSCGAVVDGIAPEVISDNCLNNVSVIYEVRDSLGIVLDEGLADASGTLFTIGRNIVTYKAFDQNIVLITEVIQDGTLSGIEVGNFGPGSMNLSCAILERVTLGVSEEFEIPNSTIVGVGEVYTHDFTMIPSGQVATYRLKFLDRIIDEITINSTGLNGENIIRISPVDTDSSNDFIVANPCNLSSYGDWNPGLVFFDDNGSKTSLQSHEPNMDSCSFEVEVIDIEAPFCAEYDTTVYVGMPMALSNGSCVSSEVNIPSGIVGDINISNLEMSVSNAGAISVTLTSPSGTQITLFNNLSQCNGTMGIDVNLDDQGSSSIVLASCDPLGNGSTFRPVESLKNFYGEDAQGIWTLEIYASDVVIGSLDNWELEISSESTFAQPDVTILNDAGQCDANFEWTHPVFGDNCCIGSMTVTYRITNDITGESSEETEIVLTESGFVDLDGTLINKVFKVGKTEVIYNLIDASGNESICSFEVTVIDDEMPTFPQGCMDITIPLDPGECEGVLTTLPQTLDNCQIKELTFCDDQGDVIDVFAIPVGINTITAKAEDIYGNIGTCTFIVEVIEHVPGSSSLACVNAINLSLGPDCMATLNANMLLEGGDHRCYDNYCLECLDPFGNVHPIVFDLTDVGQVFTVTVRDCMGSGNACTTLVTIEEKLIPIIECPRDTVLYCNQDPQARNSAGELLTGELELLSCEPNSTITFSDEIFDGGTCGDPRAEIVRVWRIIDQSGNQETCNQRITILPFETSLVVFPDPINYQNSISCAEVDANPDIVLPEYTGYPTLNGSPISGDHYCDINYGYWDEVLQDANCPSGFEILRHWTITSDCIPIEDGVNPIKNIQRIKVDDTTPPIVYPIEDITVSTDPWSCTAKVKLPEIVHDDDCSGYSVKWNASYGLVQDSMIYNLLKGETVVNARITDDCGNYVLRTFKIHVIDMVPPVAVTKQDIVVSLSNGGNTDGSAKLYVNQFDNGSFDNCSDVFIELRRVDAPDCDNLGINDHNNNNTYDNSGHDFDNPNDTDNGEFIKVCCEDITNAVIDVNNDGELDPGYIQVFVRVWDDANMTGIYGDELNGISDNFNESWVYVKVENKLPPIITCPEDVTIYCDDGLKVSDDYGTGFVSADSIDFSLTNGPAVSLASCGDVPVVFKDILQLNSCGVGTVIRQWQATSGQNTVVCQQVITVLGRPSGVSIIPPSDNVIAINECTLDESHLDLNRPIIEGGACDLIGENIQIDTFLFEGGVCKKWVVKYEYLNWCTDEKLGPYYAYYAFNDVTKPEIESCTDTIMSVDENCSGVMSLTNSAEDNGGCSDNGWLKWQVFIDTWADGSIDYIASSYVPSSWTTFRLDPSNLDYPGAYWIYLPPTSNGEATKQIEIAGLDGAMSNHKVEWNVTDGCHNESSCEHLVMLVDQKAPTPYCLSISTGLMADPDGTGPLSAMLEIWAKDFDRGSFDNCTSEENLFFTLFNERAQFNDTIIRSGSKDYLVNGTVAHYFDETGFLDFDGDGISYPKAKDATVLRYLSGDIQKWNPEFNSSSKVMDCDEYLDQGNSGYPVQMTVWDEKGNADFCTSYLTILDNSQSCDQNGNGRMIAGNITTPLNQKVELASVELDSDQPEYPVYRGTNSDGRYEFNYVREQKYYKITPHKDDDYMNGISTLDLVLIQRHILGLDTLDSPYLLIAADVNSDAKIRASDLVDLRKLILGVSNSFPLNNSWRFVDKDFVFADVMNPWSFVEERRINNLQNDAVNEDFYGIKIGDVNNSVVSSLTSHNSEPRSFNTWSIATEDRKVKRGEVVIIPVKSFNNGKLFGFQGELKLSGLDYISTGRGKIDVRNRNFHKLSSTSLRFSWHEAEGVELNASDELFTLKFVAKRDGLLSDMIELNSEELNSEVYINSLVEVSEFGFKFLTEDLGEIYDLQQNEPNPFKNSTQVKFTIPHEGKVLFTFTDVQGRVLKVKEIEASSGENEFMITKEELGILKSGLILYEMNFEDFSAQHKMLIIE